MCQMEKSDLTLSKGKLQSTPVPETKWSKTFIDFITDLPASSRNKGTIIVIIDKVTRMVHLAPCWKNIIATATAKLFGVRWSSYMGFLGYFIQTGRSS